MRDVWTIGHSTRSWEEFLSLLVAHRVQAIADVRRYPKSRRYPHFNIEMLTKALAEAGIDYRHYPALGGRRTSHPNSVNAGWRNAAFRGYADHIATSEFQKTFAELAASASTARTAVLCAEAVPWRCHRSLLSDMFVVHGWTVHHILSAAKANLHALTPFAHYTNGRLTYPAPSANETLFSSSQEG